MIIAVRAVPLISHLPPPKLLIRLRLFAQVRCGWRPDAAMGLVGTLYWVTPDEIARDYPHFGVLAQPFWFYAAWKAGQWGIFAMCTLYSYAWARGLWTHWLKPYSPSGGL